jgi:hypothetical protein
LAFKKIGGPNLKLPTEHWKYFLMTDHVTFSLLHKNVSKNWKTLLKQFSFQSHQLTYFKMFIHDNSGSLFQYRMNGHSVSMI